MNNRLVPCKGCKRGHRPFISREGGLVLVLCPGTDDKEKGCMGKFPRISDKDLDELEKFTVEWWNRINADMEV